MLISLISIVYARLEISKSAFKNAFFNFQVPKETLLFGVGQYDSENPGNNQQTSFSFEYSEENDKVKTASFESWTKMDPKKLQKILKGEENIFVGKDFVLPMAKYFVSGLLSNDKRKISNEVSEEFLTIFYKLFLQPNKKNKNFYTLSLPSVEESKKIIKTLKKKCTQHGLKFSQVFDTLLASVLGFVSVSFEAHESINFEENLHEYISQVGRFSPAENAINLCTTAKENKLYLVEFTHLFDGITKYNVTKKGSVSVKKKYLDLEIFDTMLKESNEESIKKKTETEPSKTLTQLSYKIINKDDNRLYFKIFYTILINKKERDKVLQIINNFLELKPLANEFVIRPGWSTIFVTRPGWSTIIDIISATIK